MKKNLPKFPLLLVTLPIYTIAVLFILWNVCYGFVIGYFLLMAVIAFILFFKEKTHKRTLLFFITGLLFYLITIPITIFQYQSKSKSIYNKIENGQQLKLNEKISIYGLNLTIGLSAFPFYPEVAKETLLLCFPTKKDTRIFKSNFFLRSPKIQKAFNNNKKNISWSRSEFTPGHRESRYALALNPCTLSIVRTETGPEYNAAVDVRYSKRFEVVLVEKPIRISIEEGLFWYLQEINWLHPYKAIWVSTSNR